MTLERLGPSAVVVTSNEGSSVLYSYGRPVAFKQSGVVSSAPSFARVADYVSRTTEGHIQKFFSVGPPIAVPRIEDARLRRIVEEL